MQVKDVVALFQSDGSLLMLPVCGDSGLEGVISRRELFSTHLSKSYATELYGKKPISILMSESPLLMPSEIDINEALIRLLAHDPELVTDSFPATEENRYLGIVHVAEMIMAISRAQAGLLDTLELLNARIRSEVNKAQQIQQGLLPPSSFRFAGLELDAVLINSTEISGDFYDYFIIDHSHLGLLIGDVSGHGVQSGMVATAAKAGLQILLDRGIAAPGELLAGINSAVLAISSNTMMMTAVVAVIDLATHTVTLANAGHPYPYFYHAAEGTVSMQDGVGGFPLGFDSESTYAELVVGFERGDRMLLYTDGIVEVPDNAGEEFGYTRLETHLRESIVGAPEQFRRSLVKTALQFSAADGFGDDVTIVVVACE
jgi:serine phosphatase RsbU (regulator of sigma subunit)